MKPAVEWIRRPRRPRLDFPFEPGDEVIGKPDPLERRAEHELARMEDERRPVLDLDELGQVLLLLANVDVRIAVVVENPEEAVDPDVHARRLEQGFVVGIDLDPAFLQEPGDRAV